jgi:hypothetical protein
MLRETPRKSFFFCVCVFSGTLQGSKLGETQTHPYV